LLRQGTGKSARKLDLERDLASLEKAFTHLAIKYALVERAVKERPYTAREVSTMSLTTSRGKATVGQLCEAFGISRQAYYAARKAPVSEPSTRRRPERRGPWVTEAVLTESIRQVGAEVYNYVRPQQALDWMTPVEKRAENLGMELKTVA